MTVSQYRWNITSINQKKSFADNQTLKYIAQTIFHCRELIPLMAFWANPIKLAILPAQLAARALNPLVKQNTDEWFLSANIVSWQGGWFLLANLIPADKSCQTCLKIFLNQCKCTKCCIVTFLLATYGLDWQSNEISWAESTFITKWWPSDANIKSDEKNYQKITADAH